ncbi:DEAD/DEAH box helicase [Streptomyces albidoflavus]|uniref:DEAD/DEAH box helicase n=1 Tax=Streptomyces TaxID=1883 RepID=UPI0002830874|nr:MULTISPECIES: DEAD/DEAH box helicase [Streptomyces]
MVWMSREQAGLLAQCAVVYEPGDPARTGRLAFHSPEDLPTAAPGGLSGTGSDELSGTLSGGPRATGHDSLPALGAGPDLGERGEADLVVDEGGTLTVRRLPVLRLTVAEALPALLFARRLHTQAAGAPAGPTGPTASAAFWGAVAAAGLHLAARGRLLAGVSATNHDTWRAGPLTAEDVQHLRELAAAAPAEALATPLPVPEGVPLLLPDTADLIRSFVDAVADTLPRTPAAPAAAGRPAFAAVEPQYVPQLRAWAEEISQGLASGIRLALRGDLVPAGDGEPPTLRLVPQVSSPDDPTRSADADELFASVEAAGFGRRAQDNTVAAVRRAAEIWPPLSRLLPVPSALDLADHEVRDLLGPVADRLAAQGFEVLWPTDTTRSLVPRAVVGGDRTPPTALRSFFGGDGTVGLRWQFDLDGQPLTEQEIAELADTDQALVRIRGDWVLIGTDTARKLRERDLKPLTAIEALAAALTGHTEINGTPVRVAPSPWLLALRHRLADPDSGGEPVESPSALNATLRDYQVRGLRWLDRMTSLGLGGCLADDMGLGKTVQLISLHLLRQEHPDSAGPTLVVCPASLLGNWQREVHKFAPGTPVRRYHGPGRTLDGADAGFVLTTYGTMRLDAEQLGAHRWSAVVADEAQHVKNPHSSTAKALRLIPADAKIALTGTPVENNLSELWAVLDWTTPGLLGGHSHFRTRWVAAIEAERAERAEFGPPPGEEGEYGPTAQRLAELVRPFLLRRKKSDPGIAPELPPKTETDRPVALSGEQRTLYEKHVRETMAQIQSTEGIARSGLVLKLLTGLKQICNHPAHFLKETEDPTLAGRSGKLELLDELLDTITAEDGSALVFTQYVTMARLLETHLSARGVPTLLLHGGTPVPRREEMVRRFQDGEAPVFLLSLKAAGTGLNLTRADHVVHYDRWWNPAVEAQATDRAYRIGQTRPVQVHRLITEGTVEDRIAALLEAKKGLADAVLGSGEQALTELTNDELADLVELRSEG